MGKGEKLHWLQPDDGVQEKSWVKDGKGVIWPQEAGHRAQLFWVYRSHGAHARSWGRGTLMGSPRTSAGLRQADPPRGSFPPRTQVPEVLHTHLELPRARPRRISQPGDREDSRRAHGRRVGAATGWVRKRGAPERSESRPAGNSVSRSLGRRSLRGWPGVLARCPQGTAISKEKKQKTQKGCTFHRPVTNPSLWKSQTGPTARLGSYWNGGSEF